MEHWLQLAATVARASGLFFGGNVPPGSPGRTRLRRDAMTWMVFSELIPESVDPTPAQHGAAECVIAPLTMLVFQQTAGA